MTGAATTVRVRVRLFAMQRELAGARAVELDLAAGATISDAWNALVERVPALAPGRASVRFAHNGGYAPAETPPDSWSLSFVGPGGHCQDRNRNRRFEKN